MDLHSGPTSHLDSPKVESSDHRDPTLEHPSELWHYSVDGAAIERKFCFKTFQAAWKFMNDVAAEAKRFRHHPEWSNIYSTVFIRWTTHDKEGLSPRDIQLARICDELARPNAIQTPEPSEETRRMASLCDLSQDMK